MKKPLCNGVLCLVLGLVAAAISGCPECAPTALEGTWEYPMPPDTDSHVYFSFHCDRVAFVMSAPLDMDDVFPGDESYHVTARAEWTGTFSLGTTDDGFQTLDLDLTDMTAHFESEDCPAPLLKLMEWAANYFTDDEEANLPEGALKRGYWHCLYSGDDNLLSITLPSCETCDPRDDGALSMLLERKNND